MVAYYFLSNRCTAEKVRIILNQIIIMNTKNLIAGLLAGAAVGVAIGMLLAPSTGKQTRDDIAKGSRKLVDGLKGSVEDSIDSLKHKFTSGLDEATRKGRETFNVSNDKVKI